jgi:hypothetical protein
MKPADKGSLLAAGQYIHPSIYEFSLQRTTLIYTYFPIYNHYFPYNEELSSTPRSLSWLKP